MINKRNVFIILLMAVMFSVSCKKDFTTIGNSLVDKPLFEGKLYQDALVRIYDQRIDKVMSTKLSNLLDGSSNLPITSLGIYKDDKFGTLTAGIVTDIMPDEINLSEPLGSDIKILGAQLIVPYYSHTKIDEGEKVYELDSIFGENAFELKIYEQMFLLNTYDADTGLEDRLHFYSDFDINPFLGPMIADTIGFNVSNEPYITYQRNDDGTFILDDDGEKIVKDSLEPHLIIKLDTTFFRQKIFDHSGELILTDAEKFKDYFRGLYIEPVSNNGDGLLMQLDFSKAKVNVQFTATEIDDNGTPNFAQDDIEITVYKELEMKLGNTVVNLYDNTLSNYAQTALNNSDLINGDDEIVLKGEAGSEAVIQLFDEQQLRELRQKDWMINHAELYLYVNETASDEMLAQPKRLYLYDYDNHDNIADITSAPENLHDNDFKEYSGKLKTDGDGHKYYRFGITRHIRNILKKDSTNVRLGLRIAYDIPAPVKIRDYFKDPDAYNPKGVILYGNQTTTDLKPVLKIHYTDPD